MEIWSCVVSMKWDLKTCAYMRVLVCHVHESSSISVLRLNLIMLR